MSNSNMRYQYYDHNAVEQIVKESGLDYVLVRPSRLVESSVEDVKVWPGHGKGVPLMASTSRISVAHFMVDALENTEWDHDAPVITN